MAVYQRAGLDLRLRCAEKIPARLDGNAASAQSVQSPESRLDLIFDPTRLTQQTDYNQSVSGDSFCVYLELARETKQVDQAFRPISAENSDEVECLLSMLMC